LEFESTEENKYGRVKSKEMHLLMTRETCVLLSEEANKERHIIATQWLAVS
jgi:hypothetical protein